MKLPFAIMPPKTKAPAAFRRLCVETKLVIETEEVELDPAAFRRLCVETVAVPCQLFFAVQPPSGGCVLKHCWDKC